MLTLSARRARRGSKGDDPGRAVKGVRLALWSGAVAALLAGAGAWAGQRLAVAFLETSARPSRADHVFIGDSDNGFRADVNQGFY
jgi:hypothetical protein